MAKSVQRFDYVRFGEALVERGLVDREVLNHVLNQVNQAHALLPEVLVRENLVSDWEVSRVVCELYHLPFLTVEHCPPSKTALDGYDLAYLRHFALVPLDRYGGLVTVIMPGLVPSEVLDGLRPAQGGRVLPVVGSVVSNRRWLDERLAPQKGATTAGASAHGHAHPAAHPLAGKGPAAPAVRGPIPAPAKPGAPAAKPGAPASKAAPPPKPEEEPIQLAGEEDWGTLFDAGDEAVQLDLKKLRP